MPTRRDLARRPPGRHRRQRPPRRRAPRRRRRGGLPRRRHPRPRLDRGVLRRRGDDRGRPVAGLGGEPGARRPIGEHPGAVRGARPGRGLGLHRAGDQPPRPDVRHGADRLRGGRGGRRRRGHPRARPERADVHVPAPDRLRDVGPGRRDRGGLAGPGLHPGRPLPVQRQEVRRRPRGDDRGDPARLPARDRRRLPQHRHRLLDAGRPVEAERRRAAARELPSRGRADRAHPDARDRRRDGQRRRRDRRGRHAELDRRGAARVPRRLSPRARRAGPGRHGHLQGQRPDRDLARRRAAARRRRGRGQARLRGPRASSASSPASTAWPGAVQHGASTLPDELFHRFPAVETAEIHLATGFQNALYEHPAFPQELHREIEAWCFANAPTSASPTRPTSSSCTRPARRRSGRSSAQLWDLDDEGRDPRRPAAQDRVPVHRARVNDSREMVERYVHPVELHRPMPDALREAVAAR